MGLYEAVWVVWGLYGVLWGCRGIVWGCVGCSGLNRTVGAVLDCGGYRGEGDCRELCGTVACVWDCRGHWGLWGVEGCGVL